MSDDLQKELSQALQKRGRDYKPRTHHLNPDGSPKYTNRLIRSTSPYLLQHAHNPVNFYPWGDEAFARATAEDKPILLSVGYSTCHWCHVMERESFEDEEIAAYMNEHYVAIKVDREERPDVDDIYMTAVNLLVGRGGWPMTVIMTPDREPFFGGTYFPPRDGVRGARKGFLTILKEMQGRYATDKPALLAQAKGISEQMREAAQPGRPGNVPSAQVLAGAAIQLARRYDSQLGGFGREPKFPQPSRLTFLMRFQRRTGDLVASRMIAHTLTAMAAGGMYDQVGGGFHRYSVDARWLVPHFEKMLYDNAQLAVAYLEGYQLTGEADFARVATEILDYVTREMTAPEGGFYSATDADSDAPGGHQEEGYFFTWTPQELERVLGPERAALVSAHYGVTPRGNFEGRTIFHTPRPLDDTAKAVKLSVDQLSSELSAARKLLYAERAKRPPPLRDDKVLTAWNGLMIAAFARGALVLDRPDYAKTAAAAARFALTHLRDKRGRLLRTYMDSQAANNGYLDDHAFLIEGLLNLYETTAETSWLQEAVVIQAVQDKHFLDAGSGGYFSTSDDHEKLLTRDKKAYDGAVPSGNSVAVLNLLRLSEFSADVTYRQRAEQAMAAFGRRLGAGGSPRMLAALDYYLDVPLQIVVVLPDGASRSDPLVQVVRRTFVPNRIVSVLTQSQVEATSALIPLVQGKVAIGGKPTAYVCEQGRCELPTSSPRVLAQQLNKPKPLLGDGAVPPLQISAHGEEPAAWFYDKATNKHWHPGHKHWHDGKPPKQR